MPPIWPEGHAARNGMTLRVMWYWYRRVVHRCSLGCSRTGVLEFQREPTRPPRSFSTAMGRRDAYPPGSVETTDHAAASANVSGEATPKYSCQSTRSPPSSCCSRPVAARAWSLPIARGAVTLQPAPPDPCRRSRRRHPHHPPWQASRRADFRRALPATVQHR